MPRIACVTLGCKVNQYDTEAMLELLEKDGYTSVDFSEDADVYLINTCTVTGTGDRKSLKLIRRIGREHPDAAIIVAGCLAQRTPNALKLPGVRLLIGVTRRGEVCRLLKRALEENTVIDATEPLKNAAFERLTVFRHEGKTRATLKIQEGCNRFCTYCVIPFVRGPIRSMPIEDVVNEAERLAASGYKELVLTGIHLASYGLESGANKTLSDAVSAVNAVDGIKRIRLGSLEPKIVTEEFALGLSKCQKLCPQFHLSLQSGSETVLKRMNRRYTTNEYLEACAILRRFFPGCAITTDVIAGFPGETDEEFKQTCDFIRKAVFARIHVFPYSRRSGTAADKMPGQVSEEVKKQRAAQLLKIADDLEAEYVKSCVGTKCEVLFETCENGISTGYTRTYVRVSASARPGEIKTVLIEGASGTLALGKIIEQ